MALTQNSNDFFNQVVTGAGMRGRDRIRSELCLGRRRDKSAHHNLIYFPPSLTVLSFGGHLKMSLNCCCYKQKEQVFGSKFCMTDLVSQGNAAHSILPNKKAHQLRVYGFQTLFTAFILARRQGDVKNPKMTKQICFYFTSFILDYQHHEKLCTAG